MADLRESFPSLEDSTGAGAALAKRVEGDAAAAQNGAIGFAFKDASGNVVLPQLGSDGRLPVSFDGAGVPKRARGSIAGNAALTTVAEITLTTTKTYGQIAFVGSCFRETLLQLQQLDDATTTVIAEALVGPGKYTELVFLPSVEIVAGATGTQKLILKAQNIDKLSDIRGTVSALEFA